jgi:putative FmdB family regulatory protein
LIITRGLGFPGLAISATMVIEKGESAMPQYVFLCLECHKEFTQILHIVDLEKSVVVCPHCGGKKVTQEVAAFSAVTSKKS